MGQSTSPCPPHCLQVCRSPDSTDSRGGGAGGQRSQRLSVDHGGEGLPCGATAGGEGGHQLYQCRPRQQDRRSMYKALLSNLIVVATNFQCVALVTKRIMPKV